MKKLASLFSSSYDNIGGTNQGGRSSQNPNGTKSTNVSDEQLQNTNLKLGSAPRNYGSNK